MKLDRDYPLSLELDYSEKPGEWTWTVRIGDESFGDATWDGALRRMFAVLHDRVSEPTRRERTEAVKASRES